MVRLSPKQSISSFFQSRLYELFGLSFIALATILGCSLLTHSPSDPSWNLAVDSDPHNFLGLSGAVVSDLCFQLFGPLSYVLSSFFIIYGIFLFSRPKGLSLTFRFSLFLVGFFCLLAGSSLWNKGGVLGSFFFAFFKDIPLASTPLSLILFALAIPLLFFSIGLRLSYITKIGNLFEVKLPMFKEKDPRKEKKSPSIHPLDDYKGEPKEVPKDSSVRLIDYVKGKSLKGDSDPTLISTAATAPSPTRVARSSDPYLLPPLDLLYMPGKLHRERVSEEDLQSQAEMLEDVLHDYGIKGEIVGVKPGPVVTLYELEPAPGLKSSRVVGLADDIARSMSAVSARVAVIPGKNVIGIELPNKTRETVHLRDLLSAPEYEKSSTQLTLLLGKDISGSPIIADLARMPHLLVAGTTGSGKSVAVNAMILSLIYRLPPARCKFIMIDPKMLELSVYDGIPHLLSPVVTDPKKAIIALRWVVREMESRYQAMSKLSVRNIEGYNQRILQAKAKGDVITRRVQTGFDPETGKPIFEDQSLPMEPLPFIVVVVDEMADLMLVAGKEIEAAVQRLAQMARAAGIHLIMATQRPSVDVITGTIKANFPTRISFQVTSKIDSRTILGEQGAEQLLGQGDMLYMASGGRISRVHGPYVGDADVEKVVQFLKSQSEPSYVEDITVDPTAPELNFGGEENSQEDALYQQALELVYREQKASTSFIQRHLKIGYNRAARLIDKMEEEGLISGPNHVGKREVLAKSGSQTGD